MGARRFGCRKRYRGQHVTLSAPSACSFLTLTDKTTRERAPRRGDDWAGVSSDSIDRFIDVMCVERKLLRGARRAYRKELSALDRWMQRTKSRTLVTARSHDLHNYLRKRMAEGCIGRQVGQLLTCVRNFYDYLRESGSRGDDPAVQCVLRTPSLLRIRC